MDNQQERSIELAWLAGIVEGEGSFGVNISIRPNGGLHLFPHFSLGNTDVTMMEEALAVIHVHNVSGRISPPRMLKKSIKKMYSLQLTGMLRMSAFLRLILPYLRTTDKRTDAVLVREFCESRLAKEKKASYSNRELDIFHELRSRHGRPPIEILRDFTLGPGSREKFRVKIKSGL